MIEKECLHAPPESGLAVSPCCGRTLREFSPYDRIVRDPAQVTCGRLSEADITLLSGQPVIADPDHDRLVFTMAATVCSLSGGAVSLRSAHEGLAAAILELLPAERPLARWSTTQMIDVTARAQELAGNL